MKPLVVGLLGFILLSGCARTALIIIPTETPRNQSLTCSPIGTANSQAHAGTETPNLLFDRTCKAPCLLGITPGTTTEDDARRVVQGNPAVDTCFACDSTRSGGIRWIECNSFEVTFSNGLARSISFWRADMAASDILDALGPPDAVDTVNVGFPSPPPRSTMTLFYDGRQATVSLPEEQEGLDFRVASDSKIGSVAYWDTETYDSFRQHSQTWVGYGVYHARP